jgi:hypothetical protein
MPFLKPFCSGHGDNNIDEFIENHAGILENLNIPLKRKNIDKTKIKYGNLLLNFCKANQFFYCK